VQGRGVGSGCYLSFEKTKRFSTIQKSLTFNSLYKKDLETNSMIRKDFYTFFFFVGLHGRLATTCRTRIWPQAGFFSFFSIDEDFCYFLNKIYFLLASNRWANWAISSPNIR
jgi:hypothetical protein